MDLLELFATIGLDKSEYDKGLDDAEKKAGSIGSKIGSAFKALGVVTGAAIGAAATGIGILVKSSVDGYAEYEQLVGGVQKLYGNMGQSLDEYAKSTGKTTDEVAGEWQKLEDAQNTVLDNARNAYKTAGMDMNTYMDNATSFSASLINSLGGDTQAAADATDVAMRSISDNFNTFGGNLESITDAYKGFSKENYTMLDNLKLGYGGTKEEMERLIADANEWGAANGKASDLSIDSFADVVTAIEQIQEKQNIAGTTAREATTTIAGSLGMLKAAWSNLVTGFSDSEADVGQLINNVIEAIVGGTDEAGNHINGFLDNIIPAITQALTSISGSIGQVADVIAQQIPELATNLLPSLIEGAVSLVSSFAGTIPTLISTLVSVIINQAPSIIDAAGKIVVQLLNALPKIFSQITNAVPTLLAEVGKSIVSNGSTILEAFSNVWKSVGDGVKKFAKDIVPGLAEGITKTIPQLVSTGVQMLTDFLSGLSGMLGDVIDIGIEILNAIVDGVIDSLPSLIAAVPQIIETIVSTISTNLPKILEAGVNILLSIANGIIDALPNLIAAIPQIISAIWNGISSVNWIQLGVDLLNKIKDGIQSLRENLWNTLLTIGKTALEKFKDIDWLGVGKSVITYLINAVKALLPDYVTNLFNLGKQAINKFKSIDWIGVGKNVIQGLINGVKNAGSRFVSAIVDLGKQALNGIKDFFGIHSPSTLFRDDVGRNLVLGLAEGVRKNEKYAKASMEEVGSAILDVAQKTLDNYRVYQQISLADEAEYWSQVRDQTQEGTQARIDADKKLLEAEERWDKQREKLYTTSLDLTKNFNQKYANAYQESIDKISAAQDKFAKGVEKVDSRLKENLKKLGEDLSKETKKIYEDLQKDIDKINSEYEKAVSSRAKSIAGQTGLFDRVSFETGKTKDDLLYNLNEQVVALDKWDFYLRSLGHKLGFDNPLMEELRNTEAGEYTILRELDRMSDEELQKYVELYNKKQRIAEERAVRENQTLRKEADAEIESLKNSAGVQIVVAQENARKLRAEYMNEAEEDRKQLRTEMEQTVEEIRKAADKQMTELKNEYVAALDDLAWTCRDEGNDVGKLMMRGMQEGIEENLQDVVDAAVEAARAAYQAAVAELDIHSPSKKFIWIGKMVDKGFAEGIAKGEKEITDQMKSVLGFDDTSKNLRVAVSKNREMGYNREYNQTINITSPQPLSPSEVARQTRIANQQMVLALNGV